MRVVTGGKTTGMTANETEDIRVILVDDHPLIREGVQAQLDSTDHIKVVGEAETAEEGVQLASETQPDVAVLDITLPDMSGIRAIRRVHEVAPDTGVLILSMHDDANYVRESVRMGARGYLVKDSSSDYLQTAIELVARGGAFFDPSVSQHLVNTPSQDRLYQGKSQTELTEREREVLALIAKGLINKEIASRLFLSVRTVESHRENLMRKLNMHGTAALTKYAIAMGLVQPER